MGRIDNSPLIEAIFELQWGERMPGHFEYEREETELLPGIFTQLAKEEGYSFAERLSDLAAPSIPYICKHRFRKATNKWPCFQLGMGIFTANQIGAVSVDAGTNDEYDWDIFKLDIKKGLSIFDNSHPSGISELISPLGQMRYQDGFILEHDETFEEFVSNKIKADIHLSKIFLNNQDISNNSSDLRMEFIYETTRPKGHISISVFSAQINGKRGVVIETKVASRLNGRHQSVESLMEWAEEAHDLQRHSFKTLITG